jgi:hypothetical protein
MLATATTFNPLAVVPGVYDISLDTYHAAEGVSKSDLFLLSRSPKHYQQHKATPTQPTPTRGLGTALHVKVLEPAAFSARFLRHNQGRRTKAFQECIEENPGFTVLTAEEYDTVSAMADAVIAHPLAGPLFTGGIAERSFFYHDPVTGILCKTRPDYYREADGFVVDLKSTVNASPEAFTRTAYNLMYHMQASMMEVGIRTVTGRNPRNIFFVAVENEAPYAVAVYMADHEFLGAGYSRTQKALRVYAECRSKNRWPGYSDDNVLPLGLPAWATD